MEVDVRLCIPFSRFFTIASFARELTIVGAYRFENRRSLGAEYFTMFQL